MSDIDDRVRECREWHTGHNCDIGVLLAELDAVSEERDRFRGHSQLLNRVAWRISVALGDVPEGADRVESLGVLEDLDRLIAKDG